MQGEDLGVWGLGFRGLGFRVEDFGEVCDLGTGFYEKEACCRDTSGSGSGV